MKMTWREKTVVKILLMVAKIVCEDDAVCQDIQALANHISAELLGK